MRLRNPQIESEVFRAFRLTRTQVEKMPDGELLGAFNRVVVEMVVRDQSPAIIEQLQMQIDLLLAMPERKKVPRKKRRGWRYWEYGEPINYAWGVVERGVTLPNETHAVDTAIKRGETIADVEFDPDDEPPGVLVDHTYGRQKIQAAIEDAAEAEAENKREAALFEDEYVALAASLEGQE
jgi:hypothetical protein